MSEPKNESEISRHRMAVQAWAPGRAIIDDMLMEALRIPGRLIELPIQSSRVAEALCLTVEIEPSGKRPVWNLYAGAGADSRVLWNYILSDTDMICEVLSLSVSSHAADVKSGAESTQSNASSRSVDSNPTKSTDVSAPSNESISQAPSNVTGDILWGKDNSGLSSSQSKQNFRRDTPHVMLGQILVESGLIPEPILDAALNLQEMVCQSTLTPDEAAEALRKVHSLESNLEDVIAEVKRRRQQEPPTDAVELLRQAGFITAHDITKAKNVVEQFRKAGFDSPRADLNAKTLLELFQSAGFVTDDDIRKASNVGSNSSVDICKSLLSSSVVDSLCFEVASRFAKHIGRGIFKLEQAVIALHYSQRCRTGFEETVHSLGWSVPIES